MSELTEEQVLARLAVAPTVARTLWTLHSPVALRAHSLTVVGNDNLAAAKVCPG